MNRTLGIIGLGRMGNTLLRGLISAGYDPRRIHACTLEPEVLAAAADLGVWTHTENRDVARAVEVLLLAVKPKDVGAVLADLGDLREGTLVISIVAGIRVATLVAGLPLHARVVRAMPNIPALVRAGITVLYGGAAAQAEDLATARHIFETCGAVEEVTEEKLLDPVTALSASGPAFIFTAIEALADGGVLMGLPRDLAHRLAVEMVRGSAELCRQRGDHPARLRDEVASPGGTTIFGLRALERAGFRAALIAAVEAASRRASELAQERPS